MEISIRSTVTDKKRQMSFSGLPKMYLEICWLWVIRIWESHSPEVWERCIQYTIALYAALTSAFSWQTDHSSFWLRTYFLPLSRSNFRELPSISAQPAHWHQPSIAHAVLDGLGENGFTSIPYQSKRVEGLGEGILAAHSCPYSFLRGWQTTWRHFRYADQCLWRS